MVKRIFHYTRGTRFYRLSQRRILRHLLSLHHTPRGFALGTAIGVFVAFTPTMGFQMIIAFVLATIVGASRVAALPIVWLSNPATAAPIYLFCYRIGRFVVEGPGISHAASIIGGAVKAMANVTFLIFKADFATAWQMVEESASDLRTILLPLTIGCLVVGTIAALATYPLALRLILAFKRLLEKRTAHKRSRHLTRNRGKTAE